MIIKKLPIEIQSLLNASAKINNYKNAIEELVYNSLDADATSVAIRIHIYENIIQVIDNGFGITKYDIPLLGQRYASSKVTDASSLKSAPNKFGFRGESLSNIIEVSHCVKITTRHKDSEETWVKSFYKGQPKHSQVTSMRPSKGTTVEVKGFLYNLHIQKKATNPLNELQCIKLFLQQISLVNTNVSISLRDDSKNEIIFKVHKNRDVYQTLSSLYGINKKDLQELQIEKHQYKAKGFMGRQNIESNSYRWIYLNGRFIHKCSLHDIINSTFTKNKQQCRNMKAKNNVYNFEKEKQNNENEIPTYFIFITCPHLDYDINVTSTKTIVEFKDWIQIKHMLEKLVEFYRGDIKLKKIDVNENERKNNNENTREEVRKIMEKVLGNQIKNQRITQLHKSVKGKTVKKKKTKSRKMQKLKNIHKFSKESTKIDHKINVCIDNPSSITKEVPVRINLQLNKSKCIKSDPKIENHGVTNKAVRSTKEMRKNEINPIQQNEKNKNTVNDQENIDYNGTSRQENTSMINNTPINNHIQIPQILDKQKQIVKQERTKTKPLKTNEKRKLKAKQKIDSKMKKYLKEKQFKLYRENLKEKIDKKINEVLDTAHNNCIKADELLFENHNNHSFHEHKKLSFTVNSVANLEKVKKYYLKSSDLLKTILNSQSNYNSLNENDLRFQKSRNPFEIKHCQNTVELEKKSYKRGNNYYVNNGQSKNIQELYKNDYERKYEDHFQTHDYFNKKYNHIGRDISQHQNTAKPNFNFDHYNPNQSITYINNIETNISTHVYKSFPKLTFESHKYNAKDVFLEKNKKLERFITEKSKENFNLHNTKHTNNVISNHFNQHTNFSNKRKNLRKHPYMKSAKNIPYFEHKSSHTIEFNMNNAKENETDQWKYRVKGNIQNTYTILDSNVSFNIRNYNTNKNTIYHQETIASYLRYNLNYAKDKENDKSKVEQNIINSENQLNQKTNDSIEPIDLCEAVYHNNYDNHNDKNNLHIQTEITIKDNTNDIARNKTDHVYKNNSCKNIKRDEMSRYFLSSDNGEDLPNDKDKGEEYQNDDDCPDDNIPIVDDNFLPINEEIDKSRSETESQILKMNESKKIINEQNKGKEINDEETDSDTICPNITRIDDDNLKGIIETEEISCLQTDCTAMQIENCSNSVNKQLQNGEIINNNEHKKTKLNSFRSVVCESIENLKNNENIKICDFKIQNRLSFVPKGMSPIFNNCNNKNICSYNLDTDYYQDDVYNNFATEILENIKIFENKVSNMNVHEKMNTDKNCLKFDAESLKNAKVFGQVDRKFIVAEVQSDHLKHLVLFDQHAVHERIRLEKNLSDYKDGDQWNGINCEMLSLTLPKDTVLYLNNFRDKFKQLGLDWKIESDCSITINSIPKAVFGKNYRQADVIIQAIKKLILEEIKAIKSLGGNTLLYPKSIMDLVFSEACRYAIKFGDKLSKRECAALITSLSSCKTPFQCAHGRPVLAVLSDLRTYCNQYKVDTSKILSFTNKLI